jgi:hypothetical protein
MHRALHRRWVATPVELGLVVALVLAVLPALAGRLSQITAVLGAAAVAAGVAWAPLHTLLLLAVLHNFTPVGFLAEVLRGRARRRALAVAAVVFLGLPLILAGGWIQTWLAALGWWRPELGLLGAGDLHANMGAYHARGAYSVAAAVHAWIELPILLLALGSVGAPARA